MDEEDGRPGARAVQTGLIDAPRGVVTLPLQNRIVILSESAAADESKDLRLSLVRSTLLLPCPILATSLCRKGGKPRIFSNHSGCPGSGYSDMGLRTLTALIQSEEKHENVPGK
jgi:hypothetical protein